jgi:diacylglycerol kinase (ATP)
MMWAGMGLDAMAIRSLEPRVRLEKFFAVPEYAATTIWNAAQWTGIRLRLWADEQEVEGHYLLAVANNIRRYMGGHSILSPDAQLDDGLLDLWLFHGASLADALRIAYDLWRGHHVKSDEAQRIPFQSLRVQAESSFFVHMDAEPKGATQEAVIRVQKRALKLLMPPDSLHLLESTN